MTGIERLHKLIADIDASADPELWDILRLGTEGGWDCEERDDKTLGSTLAAIADQIEREQGGRVSRMRVLAVVTEMERHVSGVEGMEDSPVARWARELREALGGDGRVLAADGEPLEAGQTVYAKNYGYVKCTVLAIEWAVDGYLVEVENEGGHKFRQTPDEFTHQRPVLDADGVPVKVGDTVYEVGENYPPFIVGGLPEPGAYRSVRVVYPSGAFTSLDPERLTHTKPEPPDSRRAIVNEIGDEMAARIDLLVSSGRWSDAN